MTPQLACAAAVSVGLLAPIAASAQPIATERLEATMIASGGRAEANRAIPVVEERLQITIDGQHATTTLLQVFQHDNPGQIEGQYHLRPGSGSHVEGFAYWNGEAKIVGEVFERQTAHKIYDSVTARRRDPGLLEEDGEGAFSFKVFPIQPREKKRVEVRWTRWLDRQAQTVRYRAPITRADADIVVALNGPVKNLRSPTHRLHVEKVAGGLRLRSDGARNASELVLEWDVDELDWTPSAYVHPGGGQGDGWFALALAAPTLPANAVAAKDVTIVIDRSGSMNGEPMMHAKAAAADMIRVLHPGDRVNVISFSDEVDPLFKTPQVLDADTRARAIAFVERLHDGGGTDIALALSTAIKSQDPKSEHPRVVVFMTDGQSDTDKAVQAAQTDTGDVRLFTLGLGKDVNRPLLSRLAAVKRGRFVYIANASAIEAEVGRLAARISKPLLVDVSVEVEGAQAVRLYPRSIPDLFAEDELVVTGRIRGTGLAKFIVRGKLGGKAVTFTRSVDLAKAPPRPWVGGLWAHARVDHLLEELSLGAKAPEMQAEVIELALAYNFVTPYTAFLAIPESELGDMRDTVTAARDRKRKILADNADAAGLHQGNGTTTGSANGQLATTATTQPSPAAPPPATGERFAMAGEDDAEEASGRQQSSPPDSARYAEVTSKRSGCAGCATGSGSGAATLLLVGLTAFGLRRQRRP
jgi:Ca-activated chloride channel family protein